MADQSAKIDENDVPSLIAVTDDASQEIRRLLVNPSTGRLLVSATGGGGGTPGGSDTQIQYNNAGSFGGMEVEYTFAGGTVNLETTTGNDLSIFADGVLNLGATPLSASSISINTTVVEITSGGDINLTPDTGNNVKIFDDSGFAMVFDTSALSADRTFAFPNVAGTVALGTGTTNEITYWVNGNTLGTLTTATYPSLTELTYVKGVTSAIQTQLGTKANSSGALTQFVGNGNWKVWYSDGSGDVIELALGADGTFLKSNGAAVAPTFAVPAGSGDVTKVGTPVNNQVGVWTGDGTIEGDAALTFDTATDTLATVDLSLSNDILLANGSIINFNAGAATITHSQPAGSILTIGGSGATTLALGTNSITMTGSIGLTGGRVTKLWATDIESTNMPTVGGTAILTSLTAPQFTTIELGHATANTLSASGGILSIESVAIPTISSTDTLSNKTLTAPKFANAGFIADANGNELVVFTTTASAINEITIANAASGSAPTLSTTGGGTDINLNVDLKGTGFVNMIADRLQFTFGAPVTTQLIATGAATLSLPAATDTLVGKATTDTLTNKRIQSRSSTTTSTATLTPALATANVWQLTAQAEALTIAAPTGTPVLGEVIQILLKATSSARAITWNATYKAMGAALATSISTTKRLEAIAVFDGTDWLTSTTEEI